MVVKKMKHRKDSDVVDADYQCNFCGNPIKQSVRKTKGKKPVSDQVKCMVCNNYNPTWR